MGMCINKLWYIHHTKYHTTHKNGDADELTDTEQWSPSAVKWKKFNLNKNYLYVFVAGENHQDIYLAKGYSWCDF